MTALGERLISSAREARSTFGPEATSLGQKNGRPKPKPAAQEDHAMLDIEHDAGVVNEPLLTFRSNNTDDESLEVWLRTRVDRSQDEIVTETVEISPALAALMLKRNAQNRKPSEDTIAKYRRDMMTGRWVTNGEPIIFSRNGLLNDGQHRLMAIVGAKRSVRSVVVFGTERETRFTLGQGKIRTAGNYLGMNGRPDSNSLASVSSYIWQHRENGRLSGQSIHRPTKSEVLLIAGTYPDIDESLRAVGRKGNGVLGGKAVLAFCHWTFSRKSPTAAVEAFFEALLSGAGLDQRSPILYVRNRLLSEKGRLRPNEKAELLIRAWNAFRKGERPKTLPILGGDLPNVER